MNICHRGGFRRGFARAATEANATSGATIAAGSAWNHRPDPTSPVPSQRGPW